MTEMTWLPIETAPKDGRAILVCSAYSPQPDKRMCVAMWSSFGGWCTTEPIMGDPLNEPPTHWLPLPEPPVHQMRIMRVPPGTQAEHLTTDGAETPANGAE